MSHERKKSEEQQGQVTGGKWMGRVISAARTLSYGLGYGSGAVASGGAAAIEGLMNAINKLAGGEILNAQKIGAMISKSAGASVAQLQGLDQKPYADNEAPSLSATMRKAFAEGAEDGQKKMRALKRTKGKAQAVFDTA